MAVCCCQFDEFSSKRIRTTSTRTGPDRGEHWFKPIDGPDCNVAREIHINSIGYAALFTKLTRTDFEAGTDCLISTSSVADFSQCGVTRRQVTHPARDVPQARQIHVHLPRTERRFVAFKPGSTGGSPSDTWQLRHAGEGALGRNRQRPQWLKRNSFEFTRAHATLE